MSSGKAEDTDSDTTAPLSSPYHSSRVGSPELRVLHELLDELGADTSPLDPLNHQLEGDQGDATSLLEHDQLLSLNQLRAETNSTTNNKANQVTPSSYFILLLFNSIHYFSI